MFCLNNHKPFNTIVLMFIITTIFCTMTILGTSPAPRILCLILLFGTAFFTILEMDE